MVQDGPTRPAVVLAVHWVPGSGPARGPPPSQWLGQPLSVVLTGLGEHGSQSRESQVSWEQTPASMWTALP